MKFKGLTQNLGQLRCSYRDFHSNCWVNFRILGQPCEFYLSSTNAGGLERVQDVPALVGVDHLVGGEQGGLEPGLVLVGVLFQDAAKDKVGADGIVEHGREPGRNKRARSAGGFKRVGRHSEYSMYAVWRCVGRGPGEM